MEMAAAAAELLTSGNYIVEGLIHALETLLRSQRIHNYLRSKFDLSTLRDYCLRPKFVHEV